MSKTQRYCIYKWYKREKRSKSSHPSVLDKVLKDVYKNGTQVVKRVLKDHPLLVLRVLKVSWPPGGGVFRVNVCCGAHRDCAGSVSPCGWCNPVAKLSSRGRLSPQPRRGFLPRLSPSLLPPLPLWIKEADLVNPAGWRKWAAVNSHPVCAGQRSRRRRGCSTAPASVTRSPSLNPRDWLAPQCTSSLTGQDTVYKLQGLQKDLVCMTSLQSSGPCLQTRKQGCITKSGTFRSCLW